jgi:PAS domain S-box-containing protein
VLVRSLGFDQSWIGLLNGDSTALVGRVGYGIYIHDEDVHTSYSVKMSHNPAVRALLGKKPVVYQFVDDVADDELKQWLTGHKVQSFGYVPILAGNKAVGVIGVFYISDLSFDDEDVKTLISVAEQAAIALENARLYEQIKASEQRYRTLFESTSTGFAIMDENQSFLLVNQAFEEICGYKSEELVGKRQLTEFLIQPGVNKKQAQERLISHEGWETKFRHREGNREVHLSTARIPHTSGTLVSVVDMTEQRELER